MIVAILQWIFFVGEGGGEGWVGGGVVGGHYKRL